MMLYINYSSQKEKWQIVDEDTKHILAEYDNDMQASEGLRKLQDYEKI